MKKMIAFYNIQVEEFKLKKSKDKNADVFKFIETDPKLISWSSSLIPQLEKFNQAKFEADKIFVGLYRPFFKQHLYFGEKMIHRRGQMAELFPSSQTGNRVISVTGIGSSKEFSALISNVAPDIQVQMNCQCFPLYFYEHTDRSSHSLFESDTHELKRKDGISDFIFDLAKKGYGTNVTKEDIFYYVYGFLHSSEYRQTFANDFKKMLPRLPLVDDVRDFWAFSKAGRKLADLHINYESVEPHPTTRVVLPEIQYQMDAYEFYSVEKMRFPKKDRSARNIGMMPEW